MAEYHLAGGRPAADASLYLNAVCPWLARPLSRASAQESFAYHHATSRSIFLLEVTDGTVRVADKPGFRVRDDFNDSSATDFDDSGLIFKEEFIRVQIYRAFFERVFAYAGMNLTTTIAIDVNDDPIQHSDVPIFAFQKNRTANTLLIPDIDFLHNHFYVLPEFCDAIPYETKTATAVFAGSTTGGRTITEDDVRLLAIPRLRSGLFFREQPGVDFRLPRLVQCASRRVQQMIEALGIPNTPCSWQEQFRHRLILSMDGNGATCSRVAIALHSGSALLKYDSPNLLYYFNELVPWRHYIPVATDQDVLNLVEVERRFPGTFKTIADEGRAFATKYLSRAGVLAYTAALIDRYLDCFADPPARRTDPPPTTSLTVYSCAHIQGLGDVWSWPGEWIGETGSARAIEAIVIVLGDDIVDTEIEYQVMRADGTLSPWVAGGTVCGTRGQDSPVRGFRLRLTGPAANQYVCTCWASFTDATTIGPLPAGELCAGEPAARLEAFHIVIVLQEAPTAGQGA